MIFRLVRSGAVRIAFALSAALLAAPASARACSCAPQTVQIAYDQAVAVFEGLVLEVGAATDDAQGQSRRTVRFDVVSGWKGAEDESVVLSTAADSAACGFNFTPGQSYLVYAAAGGQGLAVSLCSRTRPIVQAQEDLAVLGLGSIPVDPKAEPPVAPVGTKPEPPARGGCAGCALQNGADPRSALIAAALLGPVLMRRRRR